MLFTWGMGIGLVFLFAVPQKASDRMQLTYARVFRWPLAAGHGLTLAARPVATPQGVTAEEYKDRQEIQTLIANLQAKLRETERQNQVLTNLRGKLGNEAPPILLAPILVGANQERSELIISRGKDHGLAVGQFVMSPGDRDVVDPSASVIGILSSVDATTAKVRLITAPRDPKAGGDTKIAVSIGNLNLRAFLEGLGNNTARIPLVQREHKISKGDPVYVQKPQGVDAPVLVARVTRCQVDRDEPHFWDITVEPVCDIAGLSEVAVVVAAIAAK
jgi:cell shape-determining protein MreC